MLEARWGRSPVPAEQVELQLCRLYHCRPSELAGEDWRRLGLHLLLLSLEGEARKV